MPALSQIAYLLLLWFGFALFGNVATQILKTPLRVYWKTKAALKQLQEVARTGENVFEELMETVKVASLGQITDALFQVGGQYRRNM